MFSKAKKDGDATFAPSDTEAQKEGSAFMSSPKKNPQPARSGVPSIISGDVQVQGSIRSTGEVQLDGELDGDVKAATLIIGEKAVVRGEVVCEQVTVRGRVEGGLRARQVVLANTAYIQGDILHSSLSVETGAFFEGRARHSDDPLSDAAAAEFRADRPQAPLKRPSEVRAEDTAAAPSESDDVATLRPAATVGSAEKKAVASSGGGSFLGQSKATLR